MEFVSLSVPAWSLYSSLTIDGHTIAGIGVGPTRVNGLARKILDDHKLVPHHGKRN